MLLTARWVLPISSPPIENGAVEIENDRIVFVGKTERSGDIDLGDAAVLPGLVNAHCHLEFSSPSPFPWRQQHRKGFRLLQGERGSHGFTEWVRELVLGGPGIPAEGVRRLLQTGTTTVADHCSPETAPFETPFRRIIFWEVLGTQRERAKASLQKASERVALEGGQVTPHSFYAVHRDILKTIYGRVVRGKVSTGPALSVHILESSDEDRFLRTGTGPLADYVQERGGNPAAKVAWSDFLVPGTLLIHGNYIRNDEIELLANRGIPLVHCPGSHRFFGHKRFPFEEYRRNGIPIALGTDSLASNGDLSMLREMRLFQEVYPKVGSEEILRMATLEGARALGLGEEIGSIEAGKKADLVAIAGKDILKAEQVVFSMIDGKICLNR